MTSITGAKAISTQDHINIVMHINKTSVTDRGAWVKNHKINNPKWNSPQRMKFTGQCRTCGTIGMAVYYTDDSSSHGWGMDPILGL